MLRVTSGVPTMDAFSGVQARAVARRGTLYSAEGELRVRRPLHAGGGASDDQMIAVVGPQTL